MNLRRTTSLAATFALAICTVHLTGCQTAAQEAADKKWIAERTAYLMTRNKPGTKEKYTGSEADAAAKAENEYARHHATQIVLGPTSDILAAINDASSNSNNPRPPDFHQSVPPTMLTSPSVQPPVCPPTHMH